MGVAAPVSDESDAVVFVGYDRDLRWILFSTCESKVDSALDCLLAKRFSYFVSL